MEFKGKVVSIVRRKGSAIKMMNDKKRQEVYKILMMPIQCTSYSNGKPIIEMDNYVIKTTQTYWRNKNYPQNLDEDMSDFSIGFYSILYKELLNGNSVLNEDDNLYNDEFAGDTMNSFNYIANITPNAGKSRKERTNQKEWPEYLQQYFKEYHCLANFWLMPMEIGRTLNNKWCKGCYDNKVHDYMDRFLLLLKLNFETYKNMYKEYFGGIKEFEQFADMNFLMNSYIDKEYRISEYSGKSDDTKAIIETINNFIEKRAKAISESKYAEELWEYFSEKGLLGYKETYLETDEYPLNKEIHPHAYECPRCNRIIANDENYSIPPVCDECSKWD